MNKKIASLGVVAIIVAATGINAVQAEELAENGLDADVAETVRKFEEETGLTVAVLVQDVTPKLRDYRKLTVPRGAILLSTEDDQFCTSETVTYRQGRGSSSGMKRKAHVCFVDKDDDRRFDEVVAIDAIPDDRGRGLVARKRLRGGVPYARTD